MSFFGRFEFPPLRRMLQFGSFVPVLLFCCLTLLALIGLTIRWRSSQKVVHQGITTQFDSIQFRACGIIFENTCFYIAYDGNAQANSAADLAACFYPNGTATFSFVPGDDPRALFKRPRRGEWVWLGIPKYSEQVYGSPPEPGRLILTGYSGVAVPSPVIAFFLCGPTSLYWFGRWIYVLKMRARARIGLCPSCGYDVRATPNRCPECGKSFSHDNK
jgi:hypothetical protein